MKQEEIDKYRDKIDQQLKEKVSEIETNISFIIVGSLGFFLTINEKFIGLNESSLKGLMITSIVSLLIAFILYIYAKQLTTKYDRNIIDFLDKMKASAVDDDKVLLKMWKKYDRNITLRRNFIYGLLILGILTEMIFFIFNIWNKKEKINEKKLPLKIEVVGKDTVLKTQNNTYIIIDTVKIE